MANKTLDRSVARFDSELRLMGWDNLLTGLGQRGKDKRVGARVLSTCMSFEELRDTYRGNSMASKICDKYAEEMTRKGWHVKVSDDEGNKKGEALDAVLDVLKTQERFEKAITLSRWSGGAALLMGINDVKGIDGLKLPVNENAIRSVDYLNLFDPREATVLDYEANPLDKAHKQPKTYRLNPRTLGMGLNFGVIDVHASRILRFSGPVATTDDLIRNYGWGDSILNRVWDVLRNYGLSWDSAAALVQDFAQGVFKIRGLHDAVAADRADVVIKRLQLMDLSRSVLRSVALDAEGGEDFKRESTPLAGLPDLLSGFNVQMASAADMPLTVLFGEQTKGLGNGGQENTRNWYDQVSARQASQLLPPLTQLVRYIMLSKQGPTQGREPEDWSICFGPLWQMSEAEQADMQLKHAQADTAQISNGVLRPEEVRRSRYEGDEYGNSVKVDKELDAAFAATQPAEGDEASADLRARVPDAAGAPLTGPGAAAGGEKAQDTALNGAQVTSALEIVKAVAATQLPRDTGVAMLVEFFNVAPDRAEKIMGSVGRGFAPKEPTPDVVHLGPDGKPTKPAPAPGEVPHQALPKPPPGG